MFSVWLVGVCHKQSSGRQGMSNQRYEDLAAVAADRWFNGGNKCMFIGRIGIVVLLWYGYQCS